MNKVALYRKYRPDTFDKVIGQEMIVKVLTNQVKSGNISHAYLFTGSRGTGKTSCAKIFARAVNCVSPKEGSPCGKCGVCRALETTVSLDVIEMDAASNNGVDDIRSLREIIGYMPAHGKYKVYIIDEVHMLSSSAFNALLKTLEEPPAHVVFVLCTTEVHKLPATILSRCMRLDFSLVPTTVLAAHIKGIFAAEKIIADDDAVIHIAKLGEGSVRDALSIADRCINAFGHLTYEDVLSVTGVSRTEESASLTEAVINSDVKSILLKVEEMAAAGKNISLISRDVMKYARDLMAVISGAEQLVSESKETVAEMKRIGGLTDTAFLVRLVMALSGVDNELRYSVSPKIVLESVLLSLCRSALKDDTGLPDTPPKVGHIPENTRPIVGFPPAAAPLNAGQPLAAGHQNAAMPVTEPAIQPSKPQTTDNLLFDDYSDPDKAVELLGGIQKTLRLGEEKYLRLYGEWANIKQENIKLIAKTFIVYVDNRLYLLLSEQDYFARVQNILNEKGGYKLQIALLSEKNAPDKTAAILKAAGDAGVLVDKKGRKINL